MWICLNILIIDDKIRLCYAGPGLGWSNGSPPATVDGVLHQTFIQVDKHLPFLFCPTPVKAIYMIACLINFPPQELPEVSPGVLEAGLAHGIYNSHPCELAAVRK